MVATTMDQLVSLCKRRGLSFNRMLSMVDCKTYMTLVPLSAKLKRNLIQSWWSSMVHQRDDVLHRTGRSDYDPPPNLIPIKVMRILFRPYG